MYVLLWKQTHKLTCLSYARWSHFSFFLYSVAGTRVVGVLDSGAAGPGSNRSRDAVG